MSKTPDPPVCPYCAKTARLIKDSTYIYGKDFGPAWVCVDFPVCDAYVGCHPGTTTPLGRLANTVLRRAKQRAHAAFDPLWKAKMERDGCTKAEARAAGYKWLAKELGIDRKYCHIGMFDVATCCKVEDLCAKFYKQREDVNA